MNEYDSFLAAIRENPTDDLVRGVFADWLEDHGQRYYPCIANGDALPPEDLRQSMEDPSEAYLYHLRVQNSHGVELQPIRIMVHRGIATAICAPVEAVVVYGPQIARSGCISQIEVDSPHPRLLMNFDTRCYESELVAGVELGVSIAERDVMARGVSLAHLTHMYAEVFETALLDKIHEIAGIERPKWPEPLKDEWRVIRCNQCGHTMPCVMTQPLKVPGHYLDLPKQPFWCCKSCTKVMVSDYRWQAISRLRTPQLPDYTPDEAAGRVEPPPFNRELHAREVMDQFPGVTFTPEEIASIPDPNAQVYPDEDDSMDDYDTDWSVL